MNEKAKILISFDSTTQAMAMEKACKENNIEGRLIPLPKIISAGCGIAWISPIKIKETIKNILSKNNISYKEIYEMEI